MGNSNVRRYEIISTNNTNTELVQSTQIEPGLPTDLIEDSSLRVCLVKRIERNRNKRGDTKATQRPYNITKHTKNLHLNISYVPSVSSTSSHHQPPKMNGEERCVYTQHDSSVSSSHTRFCATLSFESLAAFTADFASLLLSTCL